MICQDLKTHLGTIFMTEFKHIIQNMSFVEEFVEQQLSKTLNSGITQQLQGCHSAVEDLLVNLQSLRSGPKAEIIDSKIRRISVFLEAKQEILRLIQAQEDQPLIEWLISQQLDNRLLVEIVKQEQQFVEQMIKKTIKNIFFNGEKLEEYLEQNQMVSNCLSLLMAISEDLSIGKSPTRDKLIGIDNIEGAIWEKVLLFEKKVVLFNREIEKIIERLYEFQISISEQFRLFFSKNTSSKLSPSKSRLEAFEKPDQIFEENFILEPAKKLFEHGYSKTQGGDSKFVSGYHQQPLYRTGFPVRENYTNKLRPRNEVSQLGINSQIVMNSSANKERTFKSELLAQTKSYFR